MTEKSPVQNPVIQAWYDGNAESFTNADVIELPFIGLPEGAQRRLNKFKLYAIDRQLDLNGKKVLEFGAGHGRLALSYPGMASYRGVDYSKNLVEIGNRRLRQAGLADAQLVHGDTLTHPDEPNAYDVVCSLGMMCYFENAELPIRKMVSHLRPGGDLFFDFRIDSWVYRLIRKIKWAIKPPTGGVTHMLRVSQIRDLLRGLGLVDIRVISREFPMLAGRYAKSSANWPLALRNALADSELARPLATEAWVFARKPL